MLRILVTVGLLIVGVVIGLIFQNVWLGVLLAAIVWLGWFLGYESRRGNNAGVNDEDHGIELMRRPDSVVDGERAPTVRRPRAPGCRTPA